MYYYTFLSHNTKCALDTRDTRHKALNFDIYLKAMCRARGAICYSNKFSQYFKPEPRAQNCSQKMFEIFIENIPIIIRFIQVNLEDNFENIRRLSVSVNFISIYNNTPHYL